MLPTTTAPRKRTVHQGRASPHGTATSRTPCRHTICPHTTSVSYETSSNSHTSSLQNDRFVRDFLKNSHVKVCKRGFHTRLPPEVKRERPSEHTHHAALPSSFAIPAPPNNTRSHAKPNVTATFTSTTTHNSHDSLRLPRIFPLPRVQRAQSAAPATNCHLRHTSQLHGSLRLPRRSHFHTSKPAKSTAPATKRDNIIQVVPGQAGGGSFL